MKHKFAFSTVMLSIGILCIYLCSTYFFIEDIPNEYEKTMEQFEYQLGYVNMYNSSNSFNTREIAATETDSDVKTVYLTFDDGPSKRTEEILDILKEYDIKATFFIISSTSDQNRDIVKRIYSEGHTIGVHSASHSYKEIYKSVESFMNDFEICYNYIEETTGEAPSVFRFPGGSVNNYNKNICKDIVDEMGRRGFTYFDWNVSSDDATKNPSEESIYTKVIEGCKKHKNSVVLMHDSAYKKDTVAALKKIIPYLIEQGYIFDKLSENVQPTVFKIE